MKIADEINIIIGGEMVTLHPSLRCAMRLERSRKGSFQAVARDIMDGNLSIAIDIIEPHCDFGREYLAELILPHIDVFKPFLLDFVTACAGIEKDAGPQKSTKTANAPPLSYSDYLLGLYRIGTGWLGWTPEQTLESTPAEINEAQTGRVDMLKAIFGSSEKAPPRDTRPLDEKVRSIFAGFETIKENAG